MNNNQNTLTPPESLLINEVQYQLSEMFKNYQLPIYTWKLIMTGMMNQIDVMYDKQIKEDHERYMKAVQEAQEAEAARTAEATDESVVEA